MSSQQAHIAIFMEDKPIMIGLKIEVKNDVSFNFLEKWTDSDGKKYDFVQVVYSKSQASEIITQVSESIMAGPDMFQLLEIYDGKREFVAGIWQPPRLNGQVEFTYKKTKANALVSCRDEKLIDTFKGFVEKFTDKIFDRGEINQTIMWRISGL